MLTLMPSGWLGLVTASLIAAYLSTISTSLNLGAAYFSKDVYQRYINPNASEKELIMSGRLAMILLSATAGIVALQLENALQAFNLLLSIGAGTGLIFMLRWYWDRINAWSELTAMVVSFFASLYFQFSNEHNLSEWQRLIASISITTAAWLVVTLVTPRTEDRTLKRFFEVVRPHPFGWKHTAKQAGTRGELRHDALTPAVAVIVLATTSVYGAMFGFGYLIKSDMIGALIALLSSVIAGITGWQVYHRYNR